MNTGLLNVFHHTADEHLLAIANRVDIAFNGIVEKSIQQHRRFVADLDCFAHVTFQIALLMHDFHGAATQHIAGANHQGVTQGCRFFQSLRRGDAIGRQRLDARIFGLGEFVARARGLRGGAPGGSAWVEVIPAKGGRLSAGDRAIVSGLARVSDGAPVRSRGGQ